MKNQYKVSLPQPCGEKWSDFKPTSTGGFCQLCQKNVVDFTKMTDQEVMDYLKENTKACGKFRSDQLKIYNPEPSSHLVLPRLGKWIHAALVSGMLLITARSGQAMPSQFPVEQLAKHSAEHKTELNQLTHKVEGVVLDEDKNPLPGVNVLLRGSDVGTVTDIDGKFIFPQELQSGDVLVFSFIGLSTEYYEIKDKEPQHINITLKMDYDMMGEVVVAGGYVAKPTGLRGLWWSFKNLFR